MVSFVYVLAVILLVPFHINAELTSQANLHICTKEKVIQQIQVSPYNTTMLKNVYKPCKDFWNIFDGLFEKIIDISKTGEFSHAWKCKFTVSVITTENKTFVTNVTVQVAFCCDGYRQEKERCVPICEPPCSTNAICTDVNVCTCNAGFTGTSCNETYPLLKYDPNFSSCDCYNGATCDGMTGKCLCTPGFVGDKCNEKCKQGKYGNNCQESCKCHGYTCDHVYGTCKCPSGPYEDNCCPLFQTKWINSSKICECCFCIDHILHYSCLCPHGGFSYRCENSINLATTTPQPPPHSSTTSVTTPNLLTSGTVSLVPDSSTMAVVVTALVIVLLFTIILAITVYYYRRKYLREIDPLGPIVTYSKENGYQCSSPEKIKSEFGNPLYDPNFNGYYHYIQDWKYASDKAMPTSESLYVIPNSMKYDDITKFDKRTKDDDNSKTYENLP